MFGMPKHHETRIFSHPVRILVVYYAVALLWVAASELFLPDAFSLIDRLVFILVTGLVIGFLLVVNRRALQQYAAQLRESVLMSDVYFQSTTQGILVVTPDGKILRANPIVEHMFGYEHEELEGQPVDILVPDRVRGSHLTHRENYLTVPHSRPMGVGLDVSGRRKDGSEFAIEVSLNYVATKGSVPLVICFVTDISERLAFERQTRQAETLNALGAIAAGIAHDLNNPLAIISSRSELMLSLPDSANPDLRQDLEVLRRNAERASRIVSGLLTLAAQRSTERGAVNINELVEATLMLIAGELRRYKIDVVTSLDRNLPRILGDSTALQRVLMNLLMNARDAMPAGGKIHIESGPARDEAGMLQLSIADTGTGIPADVLPKLFDIFFTTKPSGTGLGLWLARRTLREHGGQIEAESEPGRGTKFTLTIPVMREKDTALAGKS